MENPEINSYSELLLHIKYLKAEKARQEEDLKQALRSLTHAIHPVTFVKDSLHQLVTDKEVHMDLVRLGINLLAKYIIEHYIDKNAPDSAEPNTETAS